MKKNELKKPSFLLYYLVGPIVCLFIRIKYKIKVKREKLDKGSIILAPHRSYFDCILAPFVCYPTRVHIIATTLWFREPFLAHLFNDMGVIPKDQFRSDLNCIKDIVTAIKRNENVLMFPEGQMSVYGDTNKMPQGLDKLILKLRPSVYYIDAKGTYLSGPRWNNHFERGNANLKIIKILDKNNAEDYTLENINKQLDDNFNKQNDFKYLESNPDIKIKKKDVAGGLDHLITFCPKCLSLLPFNVNENELCCKECGYTLKFKKNSYFFENQNDFKHLGDLFEYERIKYIEYINKPNYILEDICDVSYYDDNYNKVELGEFKLTLKDEHLILNNGKDNIDVDTNQIVNIVMNFKKGIEIPTPKITYICNFKEPKHAFLYWAFLNR